VLAHAGFNLHRLTSDAVMVMTTVPPGCTTGTSNVTLVRMGRLDFTEQKGATAPTLSWFQVVAAACTLPHLSARFPTVYARRKGQ